MAIPMESMEARGVDCSKSPAECGLGRLACTMYGAVWYGGRCGECNEFKQGSFIGNIATAPSEDTVLVDGLTVDQTVVDAIEAGLQLQTAGYNG